MSTANYDPEKQIVRAKEADRLLQREANLNSRPLARHLMSAVKYFGIGALVHAWLIGPSFDTQSLWSWGYLIAWPFPLLGWLFGWVGLYAVYAILLIVLCSVLWWVGDTVITNRRRARSLREAVRAGDIVTGRSRFDPR